MSSYLNIYLRVKQKEEDKDKEPVILHLSSFSRNHPIYSLFDEGTSVAYAGTENRYTDIDKVTLSAIISSAREDFERIEKRMSTLKEQLEQLLAKGGNGDSIKELITEKMDDVSSFKEYYEEERDGITQLENLASLVFYDTLDGYSDFDKVLVNIS